MPKFQQKEDYYLHIAIVIGVAAIVLLTCLLLVYTTRGGAWLEGLYGSLKALLVELYIWAALGGTVAAYRFFANDKERNEVAALQQKPNPLELRYPNLLDVFLYAYRILFSGVLGVLGAVITLSGFSYFDVQTDSATTKIRLFLVVECFLSGMFQNEFLLALGKFNQSVIEKLKLGKPGAE